MLTNISLEEKIRVKTRVNQVLIILMTLTAICGGYKIKFLEDDPLPWLIFILLLSILSIISCEILKNWIHETITSHICNSILIASAASDKIIKETNMQEDTTNKHIKLLKNSVQRIENLKNLTIKTNKSAFLVSKKTQESLHLSIKEQQSVKTNIEKMSTFKQKIETIADLILELSEHIQQIGSIIGVVEDITEQTNMLALNAAVEAARAGEHGKGFAVVAGEIRKLADESKQATSKITSLIHDIQQATNSTVMATEEGSKEIESGVELAHKISHNIEKLSFTIQETVHSVDQILNETETQIESTIEAHSSVAQLDDGLIESAEKIKLTIQTLNDLLKTSENLKNHVIGINYKTT